MLTYVIQSSFHLLQFKTDWQSSYMYICSLFYHFFWLKFEGKLSYCGENNFWCQFPRGSKEICHQILNPTFKYNVTKMLPWFWKWFFIFWLLLFLFPFLACFDSPSYFSPLLSVTISLGHFAHSQVTITKRFLFFPRQSLLWKCVNKLH